MTAVFAMIGLGTMGRNLVLNMADHGFIVCGYDRDPAQRQRLTDESKGKNVLIASSMGEMVSMLEHPRRIMMLVPAGKIVDAVIDEVSPLLQAGDILIDGGNSHFIDTDQRLEKLKPTGIHFTGMGVSGGEEGARFGPSMMPGGSRESYGEPKNILEKIAAQTPDGPCVNFIGNGSAGHYTKMVHNGIEYAMMQLISEVYDILKKDAGLNNEQLRQVFSDWNKTSLQSFLIEITAEVLAKKDESGAPLVDLILDKAKQKGTGMWTSQSAMDLNVPLTVIDAAVSMRYLSSLKELRVQLAANITKNETGHPAIDMIEICRNALLYGFVISYAQGLHLLKVASDTYKYEVNITEVLHVWKGGCIIRSAILSDLQQAYAAENNLVNVLASKKFLELLTTLRINVVELVAIAMHERIPVAAFSASLQYLDAFCSAELPANLIQAQRDLFGAHTYERRDKPGIFHTNWNEQ